jgi:TRAP-type C4-dicarboxylate transport system permease small subunit
MVSKALDALFAGLAGLGALALVAMLGIQLAAIVGRYAGWTIEGHDAYAGYLLAASAFLALAYTLRRGDHIRVTLLISRLTGQRRHWIEVFDLALATVIASYFAWFATRLAWGSWRFEDISQNVDATPLWIPQTAMALGVIGLALAFAEELVRAVCRGEMPPDDVAEIARTE